jgi:6-phosphogluconolactonase (cycloisomerase 2 family)
VRRTVRFPRGAGGLFSGKFFVGTYTSTSGSRGIYSGTLDSESGKLGPLKLAVAVYKDPTFLALSPDERFLFAALS